VVCPAHLPRQWEEKLNEFLPGLTVHRIKKGTPYALPQVNGRGPDVVILSYHKVRGWYQTLAQYAKSVVFDEVHELRNPDSQRYEASATLAHAVTFRLGLSATPIFNYGSEIYHPLWVLAPGKLGTYEEFITEWCVYGRLKDPRAFGAYLRDAKLMIRHTRKQVGRELPRLTRIPTTIESDGEVLSDVEARADQLARIILDRTEREWGEAFHAAKEFSVLMRQATGIAKAPYVADYVRLLVEAEAGERVVLVGWHREVYRIWQRKLADLKPVLYTGSESPTQKEQAKRDFIDGRSRVLILSLRSGAGLDGLQHTCNQIVFGELDWSPSVIEQCIGRVYRDGQPHPVAAHFLVSDDGCDPIMADRLDLKSEQLNGIRNPDAEIFEEIDVDYDHMKKLAAFYLKQRGIAVPGPEVAHAAD
jgi:superfamily II DNA or RNA helicase